MKQMTKEVNDCLTRIGKAFSKINHCVYMLELSFEKNRDVIEFNMGKMIRILEKEQGDEHEQES